MGVYIKGMDMPQNCLECPLVVCLDVKSDCPLVPVPPHGRLIDEQWLKDAMVTTLEALKKNPKMDRQEMHLIAAFDTLRCMVEDAPTIIEAEEGE